MNPEIFTAVVLFTFLAHSIEDFHIQGILADMKQKSWWVKECNTHGVDAEPYKHDYIPSVLIHGMEWSVFITIPSIIVLGCCPYWLFTLAIVNGLIHSVIDDLKCNRFKLNLVQDQTLHIIQIAVLLACVWLLG